MSVIPTASPADSANVRASSSHGVMRPPIVATAMAVATHSIQASAYKMSARRSTMSPIAPAGSAKRKNGSVDAVWVSAMNSGVAPIETISHADPTPCMNVPISDTTSAMSS